MRAKQFLPPSAGADLVIFDIDDTLLHTTAKIKVVDAEGNPVRELTNQEFNNYELQPGEEFDFGEFRDAQKFNQESKPIKPMIRKLKTILKSAGNAKVIMLTARADFDDKHTFLKTFADLGIDMSRVHVHRAGNLPGANIPAEKKAVWVRKYLNTGHYKHVRLYDDSMSNLLVFKDLKQEYPAVDFKALYVGPTGSTQVVEDQDDYEIHNYEKLDTILEKLCQLIIKGKKIDPDKYGMVAAAVLDPDNNLVSGINLPGPKNKRRHAERVAIDNYNKQYGDIPQGSIIITTCSPCSEHMDERYGESCTDLINQSGVKKVYAGYMDPTQEEEHREFNIMETEDAAIRSKCKEFADTFLDENFADGKNPQDKGDSKRHHVPTKGSVSSLRKFAKGHSGRAAQLAHWMANMKSGHKK
jgi:pyrimidine deaminase RibD-like protein